MVLCMRVCEVIWNLSFVDTPDRANHVEYACLDRFVQSNNYGLLDRFVRNLSPYYIDSECTKNKNEDSSLWRKVNLHSCYQKSG